MVKKCKKCNFEGEVCYFKEHKACLDGYLNICRNCFSNYRNKKSFPIFNKTCLNCDLEYPNTLFQKNSKTEDGFIDICMKCQKDPIVQEKLKQDKNYLHKIKIKTNGVYAQYIYQLSRNSRLKNFKNHIFRSAKLRALKKNMEFSLRLEDIIIPKYCPILKIELKCGVKGEYQHTPSLDRIDNTKGYIPENIQVISMKANSMKNSANEEELLLFAEWIKTFYKR